MFEQESNRWPNQPMHRRSAPLYEPKVCLGLGPVLRSGALLPALLGDLCSLTASSVMSGIRRRVNSPVRLGRSEAAAGGEKKPELLTRE
jgi:hypothetical protein